MPPLDRFPLSFFVLLLATALTASAIQAQNPHRSLCSPRTGATGPEICVVLQPTSPSATLPALPPISGASPLSVTLPVGDYEVELTATLTPADPLPPGAVTMAIEIDGEATRTAIGAGGRGTGVLVIAEGVPGGSLVGVSGSVELLGAATGVGQAWATGASLSDSGTALPDWRVHDLAHVQSDFWGPFPEFYSLADHRPPAAATAGVPMQGTRITAYFQVNEIGDSIEFPAAASIRLPVPMANRGAAGPHFECYSVEADRARRDIRVLLDDQFQTGKVELGDITRLCTPVSKNEESIPNPDVHLVCYTIVDGKEAAVPVSALNQIETVPMRVGRARELCVPTIKRLIEQKKEPPPYEEQDPG